MTRGLFMPVVFVVFVLSLSAFAAESGEELPPHWWGEYCAEGTQKCLSIGDYKESPTGGWFFSFMCTEGDDEIGSASALTEGLHADFSALFFILAPDGEAVEVGVDPVKEENEESPWIKECKGKYVRR